MKNDYGIEIRQDLKVNFRELTEKQDIMNHMNDIIELSAIASREKKLENQLIKMMDRWKTVDFQLVEFKNTGVSILQGIQDIWDLLDEHI